MDESKLQDNRTIDQMKHDYDVGKEKEHAIIQYLKRFGPVYEMEKKDEWLNPIEYGPDCIIVGILGVMPLEIKRTDKILDEVHRKKNQYNIARHYGGYLLQVSGDRFCLIKSDEIGEYIESGYCNKPCVVFKTPKRYPKKDLFRLFKKHGNTTPN